jgi:hypothetical protein
MLRLGSFDAATLCFEPARRFVPFLAVTVVTLITEVEPSVSFSSERPGHNFFSFSIFFSFLAIGLFWSLKAYPIINFGIRQGKDTTFCV